MPRFSHQRTAAVIFCAPFAAFKGNPINFTIINCTHYCWQLVGLRADFVQLPKSCKCSRLKLQITSNYTRGLLQLNGIPSYFPQCEMNYSTSIYESSTSLVIFSHLILHHCFLDLLVRICTRLILSRRGMSQRSFVYYFDLHSVDNKGIQQNGFIVGPTRE